MKGDPTMAKITKFRKAQQAKGNAPDSQFKGQKWFFLRQKDDALVKAKWVAKSAVYMKKLGGIIKLMKMDKG
jgi:hypothetical protein